MITQENGTYRWTGTVDEEFDKKVYTIVFGVMGGMCVFFLVMALVVNPEMLLITLLSDLGVMAVVSLITIPYMKATKGRQQAYEMNDEYIHYVGHGKEDTYFRYGSIHKVTVHNSRNMLEVKGAVVSIPVFAAHEDFGFVRDYIIRRLPGNAKVLYE